MPFASFLNLFGPEVLILSALWAFWIWMFIDCATKVSLEENKVLWLIAIALVPLGFVIYFFSKKLGRVRPEA